MANVSSIGTSSRDYSTIQAWEDDLPSVLTDAEIGEMYNDSEFTAACVIAGHTTTSSNTITLRPASGQGYKDAAGADTAPLTYDQSKGVAVTLGSGVGGFEIDDDNVVIEYMQVQKTAGNYDTWPLTVDVGSDGRYVGCIVERNYNSGAPKALIYLQAGAAVNCLAYDSAPGGNPLGLFLFGTAVAVNCSFFSDGATGTGYQISYASLATLENCAFFGYGTMKTGASTPGGDYNATDLAADLPGANSLFDLIAADEFEDPVSDFRPKAGNSLLGTRDAAYTDDLDIIGVARSTTTPTIGAREFVEAGHDAVASDTNTPSDSAVSVTARVSDAADTNTPSDSAVSVTARISDAADTNTPSDSAVSITARLSVAADTNTPSDSGDALVAFPAVAADTNTPSDSAVALSSLVAAGTDTNTPSDSAVSVTARPSVGEDTNTPTDSAAAGTQNTCVAADTNTPTDEGVAANVPAGVSFGVDTNTPTDSAVSITTRSAMAEDFNTPSDSAICIGPSPPVTAYQTIQGTAIDQYGRMVTLFVQPDEAVESTHIEGLAHDNSGRRIVTTWPGNVRHISGLAVRYDGVQIIAPDTLPARAISGVPVTRRGETTVSTEMPVRALEGFGIDRQGLLCVTDKG